MSDCRGGEPAAATADNGVKDGETWTTKACRGADAASLVPNSPRLLSESLRCKQLARC